MSLEIKKDGKYLVCSWKEPRRSIFQGREVTINRLLVRRLKLTPTGNVRKSELSKLGNSKRAEAVRSFVTTLRHNWRYV